VAVVAAAALIACALAFHFVMTFLHVAPVNPIALRAAPLVESYTTPFFRQNWQLFAPDPVSADSGMLVRARLRDAGGAPRQTGYLDVTTPRIRRNQRRPWWPSKTAHLTTSTLHVLFFVDPLADRARQQQLDERATTRSSRKSRPSEGTLPDPQPIEAATPDERLVRDRGLRVVQALASAAAREQWGDRVEAVQVRIVRHRFPRFSQRSSRAVGDITSTDLPWMKVVEVAT